MKSVISTIFTAFLLAVSALAYAQHPMAMQPNISYKHMQKHARHTVVSGLNTGIFGACTSIFHLSSMSGNKDNPSGYITMPGQKGKTIATAYGYPTDHPIGHSGIENVLGINSGYDAIRNPHANKGIFFQMKDAPNPKQCGVAYIQPQAAGQGPTITMYNKGC